MFVYLYYHVSTNQGTLKGGICCDSHLAVTYGGKLLGRIHKNEQLLVLALTGLILESSQL